MFDSASEDSTFTLNTAGVAGIVFAAEHEPTGFERDTHYLYDSAGADIEPIAQDYDMRYATFALREAPEEKPWRRPLIPAGMGAPHAKWS